MATTIRLNLNKVSVPVTLSQIAEGLRRLSKKDIETLEILLNKESMRLIRRSASEAKRGKLREL